MKHVLHRLFIQLQRLVYLPELHIPVRKMLNAVEIAWINIYTALQRHECLIEKPCGLERQTKP